MQWQSCIATLPNAAPLPAAPPSPVESVVFHDREQLRRILQDLNLASGFLPTRKSLVSRNPAIERAKSPFGPVAERRSVEPFRAENTSNSVQVISVIAAAIGGLLDEHKDSAETQRQLPQACEFHTCVVAGLDMNTRNNGAGHADHTGL